mmetsp:Transcript_14058/g.30440  ORF Transcript_14058/g.30440 Transcript_14058/m.30440 type:complete len:105 (-) Transcript_14058:3950-4264(-)
MIKTQSPTCGANNLHTMDTICTMLDITNISLATVNKPTTMCSGSRWLASCVMQPDLTCSMPGVQRLCATCRHTTTLLSTPALHTPPQPYGTLQHAINTYNTPSN